MSANYNPLGVWNGAAQTEYYVTPPMGVPGQQTFIGNPVTINGYPIESDQIACGRGVVKGTVITQTAGVYGPNNNAPYTIKSVPAGATAADLIGILVWDQGARRSMTDGEACKLKGDDASIMQEGSVIVKLYQDTVADAPVYMVVNETNPVNAKLGEFVSSDLGGAAVALTNVFWWASYSVASTPVGVVRVAIR